MGSTRPVAVRVARPLVGVVLGAAVLGGCGPTGEVHNPRVEMMEEEESATTEPAP